MHVRIVMTASASPLPQVLEASAIAKQPWAAQAQPLAVQTLLPLVADAARHVVGLELMSPAPAPQNAGHPIARPSTWTPTGDSQALRTPEPRSTLGLSSVVASSSEQRLVPDTHGPIFFNGRTPSGVQSQTVVQSTPLTMATQGVHFDVDGAKGTQLGAKAMTHQVQVGGQAKSPELDDEHVVSSAHRPASVMQVRLADASIPHPGQLALLLAQQQTRFVLPMFSARQLRRGGVAGTDSGMEYETFNNGSFDLFGEHALTIGHEPPLEGSLTDSHSRHWFDLLSRHHRRSRQGLRRVTRLG